MPALVLASSSPRRLALLEQIGLRPGRTTAPDIDETPHKGEKPDHYARRLALAKAATVARNPDEVVLAGDTAVAVGRRILPQAGDAATVSACLRLLSGRRHDVWSAIAVIDAEGRVRHRVAHSKVSFKRLSEAEIAAYVAIGEGVGKAGGYAIQGRAAAFVRSVQGSYSGIVGLPLFEAHALLSAAGCHGAG